MVQLVVPKSQADAIISLKAENLSQAIDSAIRDESTIALRSLNLESCGPYIAQKLYGFEKAVAAHREAKSSRKRERTEYALRRAGYALSHAVDAMKGRIDQEREDAARFYIDDRILPPASFNENMRVRIAYRWRKTIEDEWRHGSITFTHVEQPRPNYLIPRPKRKPSAAKLERERQERLYRTWEHLKDLALYSLRDFFRNDGDATNIPDTFEAVVDPYSRSLNNHSTDFWHKTS